MHAFLAQLEPTHVESWLKSFFWLIGGVLACVLLFKNLRGGPSVPQPLTVQQHERFTPIEQHQALVRGMEDLREQRRKDVHGLHLKIETGLDGMRTDIAAEFKEVRSEQSESRQEIAGLKNEAESHTRQLHALDTKVDQLPERIIRLVDRKR